MICFSRLCGCIQSDSINSIDPTQSSSTNTVETQNLTLKYTPSNFNDYCLKTINLDKEIEDNEVLGCITASNECIYYELCHVNSETTNYLSCSINKLDLVSATSEPVVYIENNKSFYTNELVVIGDSLFWVYRDSDKLRIDYYILSTGEQGTIKEYPVSTPDLILSGDTRFLTWYVPYENGIYLFCFDTKNKNIENLTKIAAADSPYTRAYVNNGIVAFLENHEDGRLLVIYDLISQKRIYTCLLSDEFILTRLQANADHAICTEGYSRNSPLFLLDSNKQEFIAVALDKEDYSIFSCHLYDNYIIVNTGLSKKLILFSLNDGVYTSFDAEANILQTAISPDGLFYGCNPESKSIFILDISQ
jgi:hypothetical protein